MDIEWDDAAFRLSGTPNIVTIQHNMLSSSYGFTDLAKVRKKHGLQWVFYFIFSYKAIISTTVSPSLAQRYGVTQAPTTLFVSRSTHERYDGPRMASALISATRGVYLKTSAKRAPPTGAHVVGDGRVEWWSERCLDLILAPMSTPFMLEVGACGRASASTDISGTAEHHLYLPGPRDAEPDDTPPPFHHSIIPLL